MYIYKCMYVCIYVCYAYVLRPFLFPCRGGRMRALCSALSLSLYIYVLVSLAHGVLWEQNQKFRKCFQKHKSSDSFFNLPFKRCVYLKVCNFDKQIRNIWSFDLSEKQKTNSIFWKEIRLYI